MSTRLKIPEGFPPGDALAWGFDVWNKLAPETPPSVRTEDGWLIFDGLDVPYEIGEHVPVDPNQIIDRATAQIDKIADKAYTNSISRSARYETKYQEALRYRESGYPDDVSADDYPYLSVEAPARGMTKRQLADAIIEAANAYRQFGAFVEAKRAELKTAVMSAEGEAAQQAVADAIVAEVLQAAEAFRRSHG